MSKNSTLIIACLASAAAGVAIGMLMSDETRKSFQNGAKKISDDLMAKLSHVADEASEAQKTISGKYN